MAKIILNENEWYETCIYFIYFFRNKHPVVEHAIFCIFEGAISLLFIGMVCRDVIGTAAWLLPTESIVKQRVGICCPTSSIVQTGDPGHCSECD